MGRDARAACNQENATASGMRENEVLLITGGTGSFGNAVLRAFLRSDIGEIRIFSRDEKKQEDMRLELKDPRIKYIIGDVRDYDAVQRGCNAMWGSAFVFHAAALKQVPSCEILSRSRHSRRTCLAPRT